MLRAAIFVIGLAVVAAADQAARQSIVAANNAFAFDLFEVLRQQKGNLVVSPFSVTAVLTLAYMGARGNTATQMRNALHLPDSTQRITDGYQALIDAFQSSDEITLRLANKVYTDERFSVKESFQQTVVDSFRSAAQRVDFKYAPEASRVSINDWVEQVTEGMIKDLLAPGTVDAYTAMVLVNAIYFKGAWLRPFEEYSTLSEPFYLTVTNKNNVPMMHQTGEFLYCDAVPGLPASAIEMPYKGRNVRMIILRPNEITGLSEVEANVRQLNLGQLSQCMSSEEVILSLPKFTTASTLQLEEVLQKLGIVDLFAKDKVNLTGISDDPIVASKVVQKAFIELNENGTVAAAATAVILPHNNAVVVHPDPVTFTVDRPFLYILLDESDTVLFMGRTAQP